MITLVLKNIYRHLYGANNIHQYKHNNFILFVMCNVGYRLAEVLFVFILIFRNRLGIYPKPLSDHNKIIVSLTSFPKRIGTVWMVIDSMFHQKMRPDKICLYLSKEEFPMGKATLPKRLLRYEKLGLEIKFIEQNLKPHNKYFFAIQEFKDSYVITVDDDMYYHDNLISNLWEIHLKHPNSICSNTINVITFDDNYNFKPYEQWFRPHNEITPSLFNLALGYDGVLYPTILFEGRKEMFDVKLINKLSPKADDLWLKALQLYYGVSVANGKYFCSGLNLPGAQIVSLMSSNCGVSNQNDVQWKALVEYFNLKTLCFKLIQK